MCGKPGKGVLHEDDPHFSELFEALKNAFSVAKRLFRHAEGGPERMLRPSLNLSKERDTFVNGAEGCVRETREGCPARG